MPYTKEKEELNDLELEEAHSEVPPRSTEAEPPSAIGHSRAAAMAAAAGAGADDADGPSGLERQMSKEITIHFRDLKELELMKERAKMQTLVDECPITKEKDHHWTPTFDGSVRPRLELSYVEPTDYKDVVKLHPNGNVGNGHVTNMPANGNAMHVPDNSLFSQPVYELDEDDYESEDDDNMFISPTDTNMGRETKSKKKKKKKKKKKHVQIKDDKK